MGFQRDFDSAIMQAKFEQEEVTMELGDIIILIVFAVGYGINFFYQKNKIGALETQIGTQKGISEQMEKFMNIFEVERVEKYVKLSEKTMKMEKEEAIKKMESEFKMKESEAILDANYRMNEYTALYELAIDMIAKSPYSPVVEKSLKAMRNTDAKQGLEKFLDKVRVDLKSKGFDEELPAKADSFREVLLALMQAIPRAKEKDHPPAQKK